jgi:bacteriocin-like protein
MKVAINLEPRTLGFDISVSLSRPHHEEFIVLTTNEMSQIIGYVPLTFYLKFGELIL